MTTVTFTHGWEAIHPRARSTAEKAYRRALANSVEADHAYYRSVDFWTDMVTAHGRDSKEAKDAEIRMMRAEDKCDEAEEKKRVAWTQLNCPHTHTKPIKTIEGEQSRVCILCGAIEDEFHAHIITDITASEQI